MNEIIDFIKSHKGHRNAVSGKEIVRIFNIDERALRDIVVKSIREDHELIGSYEKGYYMITDSEDFKIAYHYRVSQFNEIKKTVDALNFNWQVKHINELPLSV